MTQKRTARKNYKCDTCEREINKGETYVKTKLKLPVYDDSDYQTGIEYLSFNHCLLCEEKTEKEKKEWEEFTQTDESKYSESAWEHRYP